MLNGLSGAMRLTTRGLAVARRIGVRGTMSRIFSRARAAVGVPDGALQNYLDRKAAVDAAFDGESAVETGGIQHLNGLTIASRNARYGISHIASDPDEFSHAMAAVDIDLDGATFLDLGSGKGRAVLMATAYPFARIIGVEFAAELDAAARRNLAARPDARVELIHGDATEQPLPAGPVVVFLYNPFDAPIVAQVAAGLRHAWQADTRPLRVVYLNPQASDVFATAGWRLVGDLPGCHIFAP